MVCVVFRVSSGQHHIPQVISVQIWPEYKMAPWNMFDGPTLQLVFIAFWRALLQCDPDHIVEAKLRHLCTEWNATYPGPHKVRLDFPRKPSKADLQAVIPVAPEIPDIDELAAGAPHDSVVMLLGCYNP